MVARRSQAETVTGFSPVGASPEVARFAREVTVVARPSSKQRAKAFLFALSKIGSFASDVGSDLVAEVVLEPYFIDRFLLVATSGMAPGTVRTLKSNLEAISRRVIVQSGPPRVEAPRHHAKSPYGPGEVEAYLANALAQPTESRRMRLSGLIALGAGAGLTGSDMRLVRGNAVVACSGGLVVVVNSGSHPRRVPVLSRYHGVLADASAYAGDDGFVVGGRMIERRNVTSPVVRSTAGGPGNLDIGRLRSTWLAECAERIGLQGFMAAAGMNCSQRLGDIVGTLAEMGEEQIVEMLS
jgi:hypothetical protein